MMNSESGIEYRAHLPLAWQDGQPSSQHIAEWMRENAAALHAITALEAPAHERDIEHTSGVDFTAARLEAKMDLVLQWVGKLLLEQHPLPPSTDVILGSQSIAWKCPIALPAEQFGVISLYLTTSLPMPLKLPAQVITCASGLARAKLLHLSPDAQDALDRTLFRHHRRALQARSGHS